MCLTTTQKWPKIAWKPITVYKVVYSPDGHQPFLTLFQRSQFESVEHIKKLWEIYLEVEESFPQVMKCILDYIQIQKKISQEQLQIVTATMVQE